MPRQSGPVAVGGTSMGALLRLLTPLRHAAAAFFKHDLALRRDAAGLQIVLEAKVEPTPARPQVKKGSREEVALRKDKQELALIVQQLGELLDELPETRPALRHLVFVEQALKKKGLRSLHKLPIKVLQRALEQLEGLVTNWSPVGLASLRSKMAVAIIDREHMDPEAEAEHYRTSMPMEAPEPSVTRAGSKLGNASSSADPAEPALSDDDVLAAAYAALGASAPPQAGPAQAGAGLAMELHTELGSPSAKALARAAGRPSEPLPAIKLREFEA